MTRANIPLTEEFTGQFTNYDTYDATLRKTFAGQRHINVRTFTSDSGEGWTVGTFGPQASFNHLPGLSLPVTAGTTTTASVVTTRPVDISTGFADTDFISLALPTFPLPSITLATSFVDLTSDPAGSFTAATTSVALSQSTVALVNGNSEFRVPRSLFNTGATKLTAITGVRFRITATANATVLCQALRLLASTWVLGPIDIDNWNGRLQATVATNGSLPQSPAYSQPILWRAASPSSIDDPRPIDADFGIVFYTGSQTANNSFTLYMREISEAFLTQLDLDGTPMSQLDNNPQPDIGISKYSPRLMSDLDRLTVSQLDTRSMYDIERVSNPTYTGWIQFQLQWGVNPSFSIGNSASPTYQFTPSLNNNTYYILICSLQETTARGTIYPLNGDFSINPTATFDTTSIVDDFLFKRRQGRIGWQATFGDGDAFIQSVRPRNTCFAEYRSAPLTSLTPVDGAQLYAAYTPNTELWTGFSQLSANTVGSLALSRDAIRAITGSSYRVDDYGTTAGQGIQSNLLNITDLTQVEIAFNLWFPTDTFGLTAQLVSSQNTVIPLKLPQLVANTWQRIFIYLPQALIQSGKYTFQLFRTTAGHPGTPPPISWWIDNATMFERTVQWSARSVIDDPWHSVYAPWTDFREVVNSNDDGILFPVRGRQLQVRARALRQDAYIAGMPKFKPKYGQLGRLVWPEQAWTGLTPPTATFGAPVNISGHTYQFTNSATPGSGRIVMWEWNFGDGNRAIGPSVQYTYAAAGIYNVTLTVTDYYGQKGVVTNPLSA